MSRVRGTGFRLGPRSALATWMPDPAGVARLRRRLGRSPVVLPPRDRGWRHLVPDWERCLALVRAGVPFHIVAERHYDRAGAVRRFAPALASGATVYLPQAHEVLPRVARVMAACRATLFGPFREESSFLFLVDGRSREGMGLHHDGPLSALWIQIDGRRTVTIGPAVGPRAPQDLDGGEGPGWRTFDLEPGSLLHLPPFTPHRVICRGRSMALSLTWAPPRRARRGSAAYRSLAAWPVASGRAWPIPAASRDRLWTQVPAALEPGRVAKLWTPDGPVVLPPSARGLARLLVSMPSLPRSALRGPHRAALTALLAQGMLGPRDLPEAVLPADPSGLDGWRFG